MLLCRGGGGKLTKRGLQKTNCAKDNFAKYDKFHAKTLLIWKHSLLLISQIYIAVMNAVKLYRGKLKIMLSFNYKRVCMYFAII